MATATNTAGNPVYPEKAGAPGSSDFWFARLGSLLSILPLGVWTFIHLWNNLAVYAGAEAWENKVTHYSGPIAHGVTLVVVLLPLLIHAAWGIKRLFSFTPNNTRYTYFGNLKYLIQRVAGAGVLLFLGAHIYLAMLRPRLLWGHAEAFTNIAGEMHYNPPTLIVYLLGTLGVAYHLGNGIWSFAFNWGITGSRPALKRFDIVGIAIFLILLAMAWGVVFKMYALGAAFPPAE